MAARIACERCGAALGSVTRHGVIRPDEGVGAYLMIVSKRPAGVLICPGCQFRRYVRDANIEIRPRGGGYATEASAKTNAHAQEANSAATTPHTNVAR